MFMLVTHEIMPYIGWIIRQNVKNKKLSDIFQPYFLVCRQLNKPDIISELQNFGHISPKVKVARNVQNCRIDVRLPVSTLRDVKEIFF
jgi:hypothetical protein